MDSTISWRALGSDLLFGGPMPTRRVHAYDIIVGNWATIADFGKTADNFDAILLADFGGLAALLQYGADTLIYDSGVGSVGGILVQNTTVAQLQGHYCSRKRASARVAHGHRYCLAR